MDTDDGHSDPVYVRDMMDAAVEKMQPLAQARAGP